MESIKAKGLKIVDFGGATQGHLHYADTVADMQDHTAWYKKYFPKKRFVPGANIQHKLRTVELYHYVKPTIYVQIVFILSVPIYYLKGASVSKLHHRISIFFSFPSRTGLDPGRVLQPDLVGFT
jgi:hypothetical protein